MSGTSQTDCAATSSSIPSETHQCIDRRESQIRDSASPLASEKNLIKQIEGENKWVFSLPWKVEIHVHNRRSSGDTFHSVGAVKLNDRLPIDDRISGKVRRLVPEERRLWDG